MDHDPNVPCDHAECARRAEALQILNPAPYREEIEALSDGAKLALWGTGSVSGSASTAVALTREKFPEASDEEIEAEAFRHAMEAVIRVMSDPAARYAVLEAMSFNPEIHDDGSGFYALKVPRRE